MPPVLERLTLESSEELNRHVHLHACVTDEVFEQVAAADDVRFHSARPLSASDLATVTQRVRRRLVRWFCRKGFLGREAAADMLAWQHSGFSVDASVRIAPSDRDVPGYYQSLERLLRYCARPAFALERLSVVARQGNQPERVCYALPRRKRGDWVGPGRARKSTRPGASGVVELSPFEFLDRLAALIPPPPLKAPASVSRGVCTESPAAAGGDRHGDWQC